MATVTRTRGPRIDWDTVLHRAAEIVASYDTGVTLRQLYYRLVSEHLIPNKLTTYNSLSARTAQARRDGWFPSLVDRGRDIHNIGGFSSPASGLRWLTRVYNRMRDAGQEYNIYIGVEKNGLLNLLTNWFGNHGINVIALGGYSSQTFCDEIAEQCRNDGRTAILIYGGDFDPSGEDILRDFTSRAGCFDEIHRIALNFEQVEEFDLPPLPGKGSDSRSEGFIAKYGELMQVELDALPPDVLQRLYQEKFDEYWDYSAESEVLEQEEKDLRALEILMASWDRVAESLVEPESNGEEE
jgi:hypothetical protein